MIELVMGALTGDGTAMPKNWNRRFKHNRDKMKTGDIMELAEVVRNLSLRDHEKGLSTGEKQMFVKAKKILVSELMYAKGMDEEQCASWLDDVLAGVGQRGGQAGGVVAGSFQRPDPTAGCLGLGQLQQPSMPGPVAWHLKVARTPPLGSSSAAAWVSR
jgi:hypothetical protein